MTREDYLQAMRVPDWLTPCAFGLWQIDCIASPAQGLMKKRSAGHGEEGPELEPVGWPTYTMLRKHTVASLNRDLGEVVMEDSRRELMQHLPICFEASGSVLVTGLGLGCVVRGLLANRSVTHIDVVEQDKDIIAHVRDTVEGGCFKAWRTAGVPTLTIHHREAMEFAQCAVRDRRCWDYAWHDLFVDADSETEDCLSLVHMKLVKVLQDNVRRQGAWGLQRKLRRRLRRMGLELIGLSKARAA